MAAHNFIELSGQRFGRLTVIKQAARQRPKMPRWECLCDCGESAVVDGKHLRHSLVKSCGCLAKETTSATFTTHGLTESPEYKIWCGIKRRCYNPHERCFPRYGGRGIAMCQRWLNSFENFLSDMGMRPGPRYSIDRIDPNGNYEPLNCRWATAQEQASNRRSAILITALGRSCSLDEWAKITGIAYNTLQGRLYRGWSHEKIVNTPVMQSKRNRLASAYKDPSGIS